MASLPPLVNLLAFEAVARRRSFALAAVELNLTVSAISHQVTRLESHVGVRLFERSAHGVEHSGCVQLGSPGPKVCRSPHGTTWRLRVGLAAMASYL